MVALVLALQSTTMIQAIRVLSRDKCSLCRMELVGRLFMVEGLIMARVNIFAFRLVSYFEGSTRCYS